MRENVWRVVISGYYGFDNAGDEAILWTMLESLHQAIPHLEVVVLSADPQTTAQRYGVRAVKRDDWWAVVREIRRAHLLISGGGSLLQDITGPRSTLYYLSLLFLARLLGRPVFFYAQGVGPLQRGYLRWLARWVLNRVEVLTARDKVAQEYLQKLGVTKPVQVTADPVFILGEALREEDLFHGTDQKPPVVGLAIRPWPGLREQDLEVFIRRLLRAGWRVRLMGLHPAKDRSLIEQLAKIFRTGEEERAGLEVLCEPLPPWEWAKVCGEVDLLIGMRLHALIFAALAGVPVVGIGDDPKLKGFLAMLGEEPVPVTGLSRLEPEAFIRVLEMAYDFRQREQRMVTRLAPHARKTAEMVAAFLRRRATILGLEVPPLTFEEVMEEIRRLIQKGKGGWVVTANPELLTRAWGDPLLADKLRQADLVTADGVGVVWASRLTGIPLPERVTGVELAEALAAAAAAEDFSLYLLGGQPGVAEEAARRLQERYPSLRVAGCQHGYYPPGEEERVVEGIKASRAQVVLVGLGSPRQEEWCQRYYRELQAVCLGVGGTFDVLSGRKKRAPVWLQRWGLEWLYRLGKEPWRWRRMLALPYFLWLILKQRKRTDEDPKEARNL